MLTSLASLTLSALRKINIAVDFYSNQFSDEEIAFFKAVEPFTATSIYRVICLRDAVLYLEANKIKGALVETGVWKGGSIITMLKTLLDCQATRQIFAYDTFSGSPKPDSWSAVSLAQAKANIFGAAPSFPKDRVTFVEGRTEETLKTRVPTQIALLRLDTNFYSSTKAELEALWPKLCRKGVLIIDDYGAIPEVKTAVDEFFGGQVMLGRIDNTGRLVIKT